MPESVVHTAVSTATGDGRNGHVRTNDGLIDPDVRTPSEMGGGGGATRCAPAPTRPAATSR